MKNKRKLAMTLVVVLDVIILTVVTLVIKHMEKEQQEDNSHNDVIYSEKDFQSNEKASLDQDTNEKDNQTIKQNTIDKDINSHSEHVYDYQKDKNEISNNQKQRSTEIGVPEDYTKPDHQSDQINECSLNNQTYYRLKVVDAAGPDQFFELQISHNAGETWEVLNDDPFHGEGGSQNGIFFLNEQVGFIVLTKNGFTEGTLYRTENGGASFEEVIIPKIECELVPDSGIVFEPFDTPDVPFEQDGQLLLIVGQGSDGDYNGNSSGLFTSEDHGQTWKYLKEVRIAN